MANNNPKHAPEVDTVRRINEGMDENRRGVPMPRPYPQPSVTDRGNPYDGERNAPFDPLAQPRKQLGDIR